VPGPVHLELFGESAPAQLDVHRGPDDATTPADGAVGAALLAVERAQRPVVIAGSLATRAAWGARLRGLRVPVFTTTAAKGVVDEMAADGFAAGVYTGDGKALAPETRILAEADVVIGLGLRNLEVLSPKKPGLKLVLLDVAGEATAAGFGADHLLSSAGEAEFDRVLGALASKSWGAELVASCQREVLRYLTEHEWLPGRALAAIQVTLPAVESLIVDTGSFCTVAEHLWRARRADGFLASANGRYMGTAIPMALGAALADPARPRICAMGDGGMMYGAELKLAVERRLPMLFLFLTDGRYGSIACAASASGLDLRAVTMANPSWFRVAEAMGMAAARVTGVPELLEAVRSWSREGGPMFVEAVFDPEPYAAMTARIR
jgi:acetolactate synthase-1/2/3 large subunit